MLGAINKILNHSSVDGPGNRFVIFFQGCNFNCSYCHNPETINICNNCGLCIKTCKDRALSMIEGKVVWDEDKCTECGMCTQVCPHNSSPKISFMTVSEIMDRIEKVRNFISGVTISGGECTQQFEFLKALLIECKSKNISTYIDTNLYLETEKLSELSRFFDKAMPDVKVFDEKQHLELTGKDSDLVFENIELLLKLDKIYEIRTVIYPELNNQETVQKVSELISAYNKNIIYKLIKFRPQGSRVELNKNLESPTDKIMEEMKNVAEIIGCKNVITV